MGVAGEGVARENIDVVSFVQLVPVGMPVFTADHRDEPEQTQYGPHEAIRGARQNDRHRYRVHPKQKQVDHELIVAPARVRT
jgi:hypothetical protein